MSDFIPKNPPGYGETIGGLVLFDPPAHVVEAACDAFFSDPEASWAFTCRRAPELADEVRGRMRAVIEAVVRASSGPSPDTTGAKHGR